jgi:hypothetical protein
LPGFNFPNDFLLEQKLKKRNGLTGQLGRWFISLAPGRTKDWETRSQEEDRVMIPDFEERTNAKVYVKSSVCYRQHNLGGSLAQMLRREGK